MISVIKDRFKQYTSLVEFVRHFRCWITAIEMIIIRLRTKIPCKTLRNLILNLYDDVEVVPSGTVVTKDVEPYIVVGGVSAKKWCARTQEV